MDKIIKIIADLKATGILDLLIVVLSPFLIRWANQASHAAKNVRAANAYDTLAKLAQNAVAYAATDYEASSADKRTRAIEEVQQGLLANKIKIPASRLESAVEAAYQHFTTLPTKAQANQKAIDEGNAAAEAASAKLTPEEPNAGSAEAEAIKEAAAKVAEASDIVNSLQTQKAGEDDA